MKKSNDVIQLCSSKVENNNGVVIPQNNGTVNVGCSVTDVKEICSTLMESKFNEYKLNALSCVNERIDSFAQSIYSDMTKMGVDLNTLKNKMSDPAMQFDFRKAEIEYAKKGTDELKLMLSNILITKIKNESNELLNLVLSEAIDIAPKLLLKHIRTISLVFMLTRTRWINIENQNDFFTRIRKYIIPLLSNTADKSSDYLHLSYTSVAELHTFSGNFLENWRNSYAGVFSNGFQLDNDEKINMIFHKYPNLFIQCFNNPLNYQFSYLTKDDLIKNTNGILSEEELEICKNKFDEALMTVQDIQNLITKNVPESEKLFEYWKKDASRLNVTSVGIVLAIQYLKQLFQIDYDYSIWI